MHVSFSKSPGQLIDYASINVPAGPSASGRKLPRRSPLQQALEHLRCSAVSFACTAPLADTHVNYEHGVSDRDVTNSRALPALNSLHVLGTQG